MQTSYKIRCLVKYDDGSIGGLIFLYEGEESTQLELNAITNQMVPVTRYRHGRVLGEHRISLPPGSTEEMFHASARAILRLDPTRTPIVEQRHV